MSKGKKKSKSGRSEESLQIYARVRGLMPWEPRKVSLSVVGKTVQNKAGKIVNQYDFKYVFKPNSTNEECFKQIALPMISNVLKGFNAVLIAYGQTGSGKTFSMLGKPKLNIVGILPRMLAYMTKQKGVKSVKLSAVEAFGHHVAKIFLFDLFDPENQVKDWSKKSGVTGLDTKKARKVDITNADDAHAKIVFAHAGSHFAPTGKNPESSRGHVTFVSTIQLETGDANLIQTAYFVMVDCAGSEGETAFTKDFKSRVTPQTLLCRRLEAGTINTGLSQLQVVFNELRIRGKLTDAIGNGLRRVLHPFINTNTFLSVLFTLSPSCNNAKATESTLKFAVTAGMVKVKPVKTTGKVNFKTLVAQLKAHIEKQEGQIDGNNDEINAIDNMINRTRLAITNRVAGGDKQDGDMVKMSKRVVKKREVMNDDGEIEIIEESDYEDFFVNADEVEQKKNDGYAIDEKKTDEKKTQASDDYQPSKLDSNAQTAVMDVLDQSAADLFAELGLDMNAMGDQQLQSNKTGQAMKGRQRTVTAEENDTAMKLALEQYKKLTAPWQKEAFIKKKKAELKKKKAKDEKAQIKRNASQGLLLIDEQIEQAQSDFKRLQDKQKAIQKKMADPTYQPEKEEMTEHCMELQIMLAEQKSVTLNLIESKKIIIGYLQEDGREALVKFLEMKIMNVKN